MPEVSRTRHDRKRSARGSWIDPQLLGRIVVARFLELPLRTLERRVRSFERDRLFEVLRPAVRRARLSFAPAMRTRPAQGNVLGEVYWEDDGPRLRYACAAFDRVYLFDEDRLSAVLARRRDDPALKRLVSRLRLVNTRNRLTHALVQVVLATQVEYLRSGDLLRLKPFSQAELAARIRARGDCPVIADASRVSRLVRRLALRLPGGKLVPARKLCPKPRDLHRGFVAHAVKRERAGMVAGVRSTPLRDREIAAVVKRIFGARLSRRRVAYARRDLGIPDFRARARHTEYLTATADFSPLQPLDLAVLREQVSPAPGVYEIRSRLAAPDTASIIYIGSARDLAKRLGDHLRGYSDNPRLREFVKAGDVWFRYRPVNENWRDVERAVYAAFCATFGMPPLCNRMSP